VKFFWLNFHVPYACRDSGMCCTSGWPIPVERTSVTLIDAAIAHKIIPLRVQPWLVPAEDSPDEVAGMLAVRENGHCVFFEAGEPGCSIHAVKPAACVHFPYVCLIDQRGVHVTLSHYCPTAASLLFEHNEPIAIVEGPAPVTGDSIEGLDARDALPPTFAKASAFAEASADKPVGGPSETRPRLMSWDELDAWQRDQVATAAIGGFESDDLAMFERARSAVPQPWTWPETPPDAEGMWWALAAPKWQFFSGALTRYAAAKAFASWSLYLGNGTEAAAATARLAAAVLRIEAARQCGWFGRELDRESLTEAIRQADLLLVHYADPRLLADAATASTGRRQG
jgi:Fe-S-cluster containining protein